MEETPGADGQAGPDPARLPVHKRRERGRNLLEDEVFPRLTILPFDRESALVYGRLKAELERKGQPQG